ncbi:MAG: vitamin K epoxide reductase family protein [Chloroflexi bacterium]|nr:vitamin K epoxide reductase family protein [Chloroflexota bacterium]
MRDWLNDLRRLQVISAVLALIGLLDSIYLLWTKLTQNLIVCGLGECETVQASPYSSLLGVPVSAIGIAGYATLLALAGWAFFARDDAPVWLTDIRLMCTGVGLFFAVYLSVIELFVLHAICGWCVLQQVAILGILLGLLIERRIERA